MRVRERWTIDWRPGRCGEIDIASRRKRVGEGNGSRHRLVLNFLQSVDIPDDGSSDGFFVGLQFRFQLDEAVDGIEELEVFSTRPDTIFGASFAAIAADHPIALALEAKDAGLAAFAEGLPRFFR